MEVSMKLFSAILFTLLYASAGFSESTLGTIRKCDCEKTEIKETTSFMTGRYTLFYTLVTKDESGNKVDLMRSEVNHSPYDEVIQLGRCELALRNHDACK
jgi:hypothetical protein